MNSLPKVYSRIVIDPICTAAAHDGLLRFSFILTTSGMNLNKQVFLDEDLRQEKVFRSPVNQAIDQDHVQTFEAICGSIYDSIYLPQRGMIPSRIRTFGVIFEDCYPNVAMKVRRGAQAGWAATSMEAWPNPLEQGSEGALIIHMPEFIGAGLVRFPGCLDSVIDTVDGEDTTPTPDNAVVQRSKDLLDQIMDEKARVMRAGIRLITAKRM